MTRMTMKTGAALALVVTAAALAPAAALAASNESAGAQQVQPHSRQAPAGYVPQAEQDDIPGAASTGVIAVTPSDADSGDSGTGAVLIGFGIVIAIGLVAGIVAMVKRHRDAPDTATAR